MDRVLEAARAVVVWADELGYYADDGTVLAPVLARLKAAVQEYDKYEQLKDDYK